MRANRCKEDLIMEDIIPQGAVIRKKLIFSFIPCIPCVPWLYSSSLLVDVDLHAVERAETLEQRCVVAVERAGLGNAQIAEVVGI